MPMRAARGVTLLELLVALVIMGILLTAALPSFTTYLANTRLKATASNIQSGLQSARMEAIQRNEPTAFLLIGNNNWMVNRAYSATTNPNVAPASIDLATNAVACDGGGTAKPAYEITKSCGENAGVTISTNFTPLIVTFTADGRASAPASIPQLDFSAASATSQLRILISPGGQVRMCDPNNNTSGDPRNCNI